MDNGFPLNGKEFETYAKTLGIQWKTITPLWLQGNAVVERFMKTIGKLLKTAEIELKEIIRSKNCKGFDFNTVQLLIKLLKSLRVNYFLTDKFEDIYQNSEGKKWLIDTRGRKRIWSRMKKRKRTKDQKG
jgi:hypothetical protein